MPIYENRENAENRVVLTQEKLSKILDGKNVFFRIVENALEKFN